MFQYRLSALFDSGVEVTSFLNSVTLPPSKLENEMVYTIAILLPGTTGSSLVASGQPYNDPDPVWPNQVIAALDRGDQQDALNLLTGTLYAGTPNHSPDPTKPGNYDKFIQYFKSLNFQYVAAQTPQTKLPLPKNSTQNWGFPHHSIRTC